MDAINNLLTTMPAPFAGQTGAAATGSALSHAPGGQAAANFLSLLEQPGVNQAAGKAKEARIEKVATEFESVFLSLLLKEMRNTLDTENGGLFGGEGSDTFGGMFDMFMGQHLASSTPLGIADAVKGYLGNMPRS